MDSSSRSSMGRVVLRQCSEFIASIKSHSPDALRYQWRYFRVHGRFCSFKHPRTFSEKIYYRMRFPSPVFSLLADKVRVRDYIRETVGEQFNVPLYAVVSSVVPADFEALPNAFVMKSNSGYDATRIVLDKQCEDIQSLVDMGNAWLRKDFSRFNGERHYKNIAPQILFEKVLLVDNRPAVDYKVHVFNPAEGEAYCFLQIIDDRFGQTTQNLYSADWLVTEFKLGGRMPSSNSARITRSPEQLSQMLDAAKRLARPFGYCRVDFYLHDGGLYVGELTFTPGAGECVFYPLQWDWTLGSLFRWPETPAYADAVSSDAQSGDQQLA